jgi:hypothetical protein
MKQHGLDWTPDQKDRKEHGLVIRTATELPRGQKQRMKLLQPHRQQC